MTTFTLIEMPSETEAAWAEHAVRERIIAAYRAAPSSVDRTAARWEAYEYDLANPGASHLVDQLDAETEAEVRQEGRDELGALHEAARRTGDDTHARYIEVLAADIDAHAPGTPSLLNQLRRHQHAA